MPRLHTVNDKQGLIDVLPVALGFMPRDSLVVIGTAGPRRRLGLTARIDLNQQSVIGLAASLNDALARTDADGVLVVTVGDTDLGATLSATITDLLNLPVLTIVNGPNPDAPSSTVMALLNEGEQNERLLTREQTAALYAWRGGDLNHSMTRAQRDVLIADLDQTNAADRVDTLHRWATTNVNEDADLYVLLAYALYLTGDGGRANMAIDEAQRIDPAHVLAGLIDTALRGGVTPQGLHAIIAAAFDV